MTFQEQASDAIRASGGRMTTQREILLDLLADIDDDINAEHLYQLATERDPAISLPTVYRTLHTLEDTEIIASHYVSSDHERKVYRINTETDVFHFTCRKCGRVSTFQSDLIKQLKQELSTQLAAEVATVCMCAGGLCADCRKEGLS